MVRALHGRQAGRPGLTGTGTGTGTGRLGYRPAMFVDALVNLYTADIEAGLHFYGDLLGFAETFRTPAEGVPEHVELRVAGFTLGLGTVEAARRVHGVDPSPGSLAMVLVVWAEDVDGAFADLVAAGVPVVQPPHDAGNGNRSALLADPDGNLVEIVAKARPPAPDQAAPDPEAGADEGSGPDSTAVRVALWRARHLEVDGQPAVLEDRIGVALAAPDDGWRDRGDMHPVGTRGFRAAIVARARFVEDLVTEQVGLGVDQYVILGAGLDTFVQRRPEMASALAVFEVDQPGPQRWKRQRLVELGYGVPDWLALVPVDFEAGESWLAALAEAGFDRTRPAVVVSTGVSMYLTEEANVATLRQIAGLAPGSTLAMTFLLPAELLGEADRAGLAMAERGARASGTPFVSFYSPDRMLAVAREAGFADVRHVSGTALGDRYFTGRSDGLWPSTGEDLLVATT